jgi:hypothetical protein
MTKDEALRLALEALYGFIPYLPLEHDKPQCDRYDQTITAIKAALEAKDEPVAYLPPTASPDNACYIPLQRTWVGLTRTELIRCGVLPFGMSYELYEAIEAKLKEKNA